MVRSASFYLPTVLLSTLYLGACGDEPPPLEEVVPRVKYFVVGDQATGQSRRISGKLVAADTSPLSFGVGGTVREVLVSQGSEVSEGEILAVLDSEPLRLSVEQARAQLNIARARQAETEQKHARIAALFEQQVTSRAELETAHSEYASAQGNLQFAQSDLARKERDLALAELSAPFPGIIAQRSVEPYQEISAGAQAFILQTDDILEVEVRVPETLIRDVDYGQLVQVTFPTLEGVKAGGVVNEIGSRTESGNAFPVSIRLQEHKADLRPGMTASVTFNFVEYLEGRTAYLIPLSTLALEYGVINRIRSGIEEPRKDRAPVYIIDEANRLQAREVTIGGLRGNLLEVYEGLAPGDRLVSAGVSFVREGIMVEPWTPDQGL